MDKIEKIFKIQDLLVEIDDDLVRKFFDLESEEMLDEKIEVLTELSKGVQPNEIKNYYKILELYPENEIWD